MSEYETRIKVSHHETWNVAMEYSPVVVSFVAEAEKVLASLGSEVRPKLYVQRAKVGENLQESFLLDDKTRLLGF